MVLLLAADALDVENGARTVGLYYFASLLRRPVLVISDLDGPILKVVLSLLVALGVEM